MLRVIIKARLIENYHQEVKGVKEPRVLITISLPPFLKNMSVKKKIENLIQIQLSLFRQKKISSEFVQNFRGDDNQ